jgi:hypothetical protein
MELWKFTLLWVVTLIAKSVGLIWALNLLFNLGIEYSFLTILASAIILFCINGSLPSSESNHISNRKSAESATGE